MCQGFSASVSFDIRWDEKVDDNAVYTSSLIDLPVKWICQTAPYLLGKFAKQALKASSIAKA
jgi:hypothetical protein